MKENKEKRSIIIVLAVMLLLLVLLFASVGSLIGKYKNNMVDVTVKTTETEAEHTPVPPPGTPTPAVEERYPDIDPYLAENIRTLERQEKLAVSFPYFYDSVWAMTPDSMSCIVKKDGKYGVVSVTGEILVPVEYDYFGIWDQNGRVEFEKDGVFFVFDEKGTLLHKYEDKAEAGLESEEAYRYRTAKAYMSGMEINFFTPENEREEYYGAEYRKEGTGELLYRAVGGYQEVGLFTYPDETGRAVAIRGDGLTNTIYSITKDGCESRVMELPEGVNGRWFAFPGSYAWAEYALSHGWVKVHVTDAVPDFLIDSYKYYYAWLNVDTLELVPFPEQYQNDWWMYDKGRGTATALMESSEDGENNKYAICIGSEVLTEERYNWVIFEEEYILGGHDEGADVFNYDGELLRTYGQVSGNFVNGRMLVWDEKGIYFVDGNLEQCSEILFEDITIDFLFSRGVICNDRYYILEEFGMEELPENVAWAERLPEAEIPEPTKVPVRLSEEEYQLVETDYEICAFLNDAYVIRKNNRHGVSKHAVYRYGLADLSGQILVEPTYSEWLYADEEWVCFKSGMAHVYDHNGVEQFVYNDNQGPLYTADNKVFYRQVYYSHGMKIEFDYNDETGYYGVNYYNAVSGKQIFNLTDYTAASMPDKSGTAVVIAGDGTENTVYKINKDGYTMESRPEKGRNRRLIYSGKHIGWDYNYLSDDWLQTTVYEERDDLFECFWEERQMLYNIHTGEQIPLPQAYQDWYGEYYIEAKGMYYGVSGESRYAYENGETENVYYSICCGNEQLTEELYQWIDFGDKYIIAGNDSFSHILNYEGEVLAEYPEIAFPFVDGRTLVCDEKGAFYIDETLCRCTDYIQLDVEYCAPNFVRSGDKQYLIQWDTKEE